MASEETGKAVDREQPHRASRGDLVRLFVFALIATAGGIALALVIDWFPVAASREAETVDTVWDVVVIASVPVFVLVEAVVLYCIIRFRMRPGQEDMDGPPLHGNTRLEIIWTTIPALLLLGLCIYAYATLQDIEEAGAKGEEINVRVVGEQFTWTFHYPRELTGTDKEVVSNQLYLPKDRRVYFTVQSKDVIHDFWVPSFRMKVDAVPGINTHYRVTPTRLGKYPVVCAELCGLGHAAMRQTAHVVEQGEFDKWLSERAAPEPEGGEEAAGGGEEAPAGGGEAPNAQGKELFAANGCGSCHTLGDAGSTAQAGPVLDTALKGKDVEYIKNAIADPNAEIAEGFQQGIMPTSFGETLSPEELDALAAYLEQVTNP